MLALQTVRILLAFVSWHFHPAVTQAGTLVDIVKQTVMSLGDEHLSWMIFDEILSSPAQPISHIFKLIAAVRF